MTLAQKARLAEIDAQIAALQKEKEQINPFANLKSLSNKAFGEGWSEPYIVSQCSNLIQDNGSGHDLCTAAGEQWEIKSSRLPCVSITFNQCHPYECDKFLFVLYDTIEGEVIIYLVPSKDIKEKFHYSRQHTHTAAKEDADCISITYSVANRKILEENYRVKDFEELNRLAAA